MRLPLLIGLGSCLASAFGSVLDAAELSPGEAAWQEGVGHACQVVALWPPGQVPDAVKPLGAEHVGPDRNRPGSLMVRNVSDASITISRPPADKRGDAAILLCPGGDYGGLAIERVVQAARWFNEHGITAVLLKYRVPKRNQGRLMYHHALQDAQRALGMLRSRATEWDLDAKKLGVGGFAAGGHLAATLSNLHAARTYPALDDDDTASCRPDFCVLFEPAYLTDPIRSRNLTPHLKSNLLSAEKTPPTFTASVAGIKFTVGGVAYAAALRQAKVPVELHVYPSGSGALVKGENQVSAWYKELERWLADLHVLPNVPPAKPLTYQAANLPAVTPTAELTLGDARLRQILGHAAPVIPVWPAGQAPDEMSGDETRLPAGEVVTHRSRGGQALNITNVSRPTLTLMKPPVANRTGRTVIVCPGGGYGGLAAEHEGTRVAQWLNQSGITALLLKYRVPRRGGKFAKHHHALQDLQRAIRIVRQRARQWELDPQQIGICGFSAGGHLCTTLATNYQHNAYPPIDEIDLQSARPDFAVLIYPAYLTDPIESDTIDPVARGTLDDRTPPLFMAVAANDRFARGMLNYFLEAEQAKASAECHVYATGGHGGGLDPGSYPTSQWTLAAERWLTTLPD